MLRLENRGTEVISVQAGQPVAMLTEVQLHEGGSDDMMSLEDMKRQGMSPLEMARAGIDGGILGDDSRSGMSGRAIIEQVKQARMATFEEWITKNNIQVEDELPANERRDMQMLAFAFYDVFAWGKKPGLMKGVEFGIDFKEPFAKPFKERTRRCSPAESTAIVDEVKKMQEMGVVGHRTWSW